jgi:hypothetical protein
MTSEAPETEVSSECLGGRYTLEWVEAVLSGRITAVN